MERLRAMVGSSCAGETRTSGRLHANLQGPRSLLVLVLLVLVHTSGCFTNPYTERKQLLLISEQDEIQLGVQAYAEMTSSDAVTIETDPAWTAPLQRVGRAIADAADKPDYEWEFKLIDDPQTVNAWALPGGKIAFYKGIYPILQDEEGMAIVMGHEVAHALLRHGGERISQNMVAGAASTAAAIALDDHEYRDEILGALGMGAAVGVLLPYSRKHESEADHYGLMLAARAGYDPEAALRVWGRMAQLSGDRPPVFLSTHPDPEDRLERMREWMPEAKELYAKSRKQPSKALPAPRATGARSTPSPEEQPALARQER